MHFRGTGGVSDHTRAPNLLLFTTRFLKHSTNAATYLPSLSFHTAIIITTDLPSSFSVKKYC